MVDDWELWACALAVLRDHGKDARRHVARRISRLADAGDVAGSDTWRLIGNRVLRLECGSNVTCH